MLQDEDGNIKGEQNIEGVRKIKINGVDVENFTINGKEINKIKSDFGIWNFVPGKGYQPSNPNNYLFTLSDGVVVNNNEYTITDEPMTLGGKSRKRRTRGSKRKHKKSRKKYRI